MKVLRCVWLSLLFLAISCSNAKDRQENSEAEEKTKGQDEDDSVIPPEELAFIHKEVQNIIKQEGTTIEQLFDLTNGNQVDERGLISISHKFNWNLKLNKIKQLANLNADLHNLDKDWQALLQVISTRIPLNPEILKFLLSEKVSPFLANNQCQTLLSEVIKTKDKAMVEALLDFGIDINAKDDLGHSLLQYLVVNASKEGQTVEEDKPLMTYLIEKGANVNFVDENFNQNSLLHLAGLHGSVEMMKFLLENGANANVLNSEGFTPASTIRFVKGVVECAEIGGVCSGKTYMLVNYTPDLSLFKKGMYDSEELAREDLQDILKWIENEDVEGTWAFVRDIMERDRQFEETIQSVKSFIKKNKETFMQNMPDLKKFKSRNEL